jgi:ferredoxin
MANVSKVKERELCISCEACMSICPKDAVTMVFENGQFLANVNNSLCIKYKNFGSFFRFFLKKLG